MLAGCAVRPLARARRTELWANATEKGVHIIALEHGVLVLVRQEKKREKSVMHVVSDTSTAATADGAVTTARGRGNNSAWRAAHEIPNGNRAFTE